MAGRTVWVSVYHQDRAGDAGVDLLLTEDSWVVCLVQGYREVEVMGSESDDAALAGMEVPTSEQEPEPGPGESEIEAGAEEPSS